MCIIGSSRSWTVRRLPPTAIPGTVSSRLPMMWLLFLSPAFSQTEPVLFPTVGESNLHFENWSILLRGVAAYRNADLSPVITSLDIGGSFRVTSSPDNQIMIASTPHQFVNLGYQILLNAAITIDQVFSAGSGYSLEVLLFEGRRQLTSQTIALSQNLRESLRLTMPVKRGASRVRVILIFDANIRSVVLEDLRLIWRTNEETQDHSFPEDYLASDRLIYTESDTVTLSWVWHSRERGDLPEARWTIFDHRGQSIRSGKGPFVAPAEGVTALGPGWYELETSYSDGEAGEYQSRAAFTVIPDTQRFGAPGKSPFGVHVEMNKQGLKRAQQLGARWVRLHGSDILKWKTVQPERDRWVWPDNAMDTFHTAGMQILATLGKTPTWASSEPEAVPFPWTSYYFGAAAYLPSDMGDWQTYIREVVDRYDHIIDYWEVWNEPDIHFFVSDDRGKAHNYTLLLDSAKEIIRSGRNNHIVGPSLAYHITRDKAQPGKEQTAEEFKKFRDPDFYDKLLPLLALRSFDIFSFHHYSRQNKRMDQPWLSDMAAAVAPKLLQARQSQTSVTNIWVTEYNVVRGGTDLFKDSYVAMAAQMCAEHFEWLALGVQRIFLYNAFNHIHYYAAQDNLLDAPYPTPMFTAYAVMTKQLDGLEFVNYSSHGEFEIYNFSAVASEAKPGQRLAVYVNRGADTMINLNESGTITELLGRQTRVPANASFVVPRREIVYYSRKIESQP